MRGRVTGRVEARRAAGVVVRDTFAVKVSARSRAIRPQRTHCLDLTAHLLAQGDDEERRGTHTVTAGDNNAQVCLAVGSSQFRKVEAEALAFSRGRSRAPKLQPRLRSQTTSTARGRGGGAGTLESAGDGGGAGESCAASCGCRAGG